MSSIRLVGFAVVTAATLAALGACGSDDATAPGALDGGGDDGQSGDGGPLADGYVPPVRAEFGLDTRPANPTCKAPARPPTTANVKWAQVYANVALAQPMMMAQIPGDKTRWFVAQRSGEIVSFPVTSPPNTPTPPTLVGTVQGASGLPLNTNGEGGLLGFAIHPKFAQNGKIFVTWTTTGGGPVDMLSRVGVLHSPDNGVTFDSYKDVLGPFAQPFTNHDGGGIAFGTDGLLYLSFGDGGDANDTNNAGQDRTRFFSKVLRIDVDNVPAGKTYGIPADNPFANGGGEPATFAMGFRNPFRFSIDRATNEVWVGDVGQGLYEEIDAKVKLGGNYGWPCREGLHDGLSAVPAKCPLGPTTPGLIDPVIEQVHTGGRSITGGVVYRGAAIPDFVGSYVFGDYVTQEMWTLAFDPGTGDAVQTQLTDAPAANWVSFNEDNDGEVYALALNQGAIYQLLPTPAAADAGTSTFPDRLSKTGCVDAADPKKPAAGLVPYGVNAPLWSDGAQKARWVALPDGKNITVSDVDGDFDFPNGTVLVKEFSVGGKRIETRLFVRHDDGGWNGYTYEWLDDQSDAVLLQAGKKKDLGTQSWTFPSRSECVTCHSDAAGRSLGLELGQLNGDYVYSTTNRISNQLKTFEHIGLFDKPLGKPVEQLVAFPDPYGTTVAADQRARAYVHSNCANCHRPKGPGGGNMDLRFGTAFVDTKTCSVLPQSGDLGVAGAKLITPGMPETSLVSVRPHSATINRMPPLASTRVDEPGVKVLDDWIRSIAACP
jgi:uncharacterized repeat protein (TIGR03806 family)